MVVALVVGCDGSGYVGSGDSVAVIVVAEDVDAVMVTVMVEKLGGEGKGNAGQEEQPPFFDRGDGGGGDGGGGDGCGGENCSLPCRKGY